MHPFERRNSVVAAMAACGFAASLVLSGCSAGQVSQTATQEPAVNGTSGKAGDIALRNVHIRAEQTTDYVEPGSTAELIFLAANASADVNDKLVSITSDVGSVTMTGDGNVPAGGALEVGVPDGQIASLEAAGQAGPAEATIKLTEPITNGLTYDFTFTFQNAGETTVAVPISAGETPRRDGAESGGSESSDSEGHAGGH